MYHAQGVWEHSPSRRICPHCPNVTPTSCSCQRWGRLWCGSAPAWPGVLLPGRRRGEAPTARPKGGGQAGCTQEGRGDKGRKPGQAGPGNKVHHQLLQATCCCKMKACTLTCAVPCLGCGCLLRNRPPCCEVHAAEWCGRTVTHIICCYAASLSASMSACPLICFRRGEIHMLPLPPVAGP